MPQKEYQLAVWTTDRKTNMWNEYSQNTPYTATVTGNTMLSDPSKPDNNNDSGKEH